MQKKKNTTQTQIDTRGLICPIPVLKARKKMQELQQGEVLVVLADDPRSIQDFQHFCETQGHQLLEQTQDSTTNTMITHKIRKNN